MGGNLSKLHEYLKNQESLITSAVEGKTLLDFICLLYTSDAADE